MLEQNHPHIIETIGLYWGNVECRDYILYLLNDSRDGIRNGFEFKTASELIFLLNVHDIRYPEFVPKQQQFSF